MWSWASLHWTLFNSYQRTHKVWLCFESTGNFSVTISPRACLLVWCVSAPVTAVSWVATTAVVFTLVATLPLPVPFVRPRPLPVPPVSPVTAPSLVFVFLWREVEGPAVSLPLPLPLSVSVPVWFDWSAGPWTGTWALPLVTGSSTSTVTVASARLGVTAAVVAGLGLEVGEEGWGLVSPGGGATTGRARTWARAVGPWATPPAVVTVEKRKDENPAVNKLRQHLKDRLYTLTTQDFNQVILLSAWRSRSGPRACSWSRSTSTPAVPSYLHLFP